VVNDTNLPDRLTTDGKQITDWNLATEAGFYLGYQAANSPAGQAYTVGVVTPFQIGAHVTQMVSSPYAANVWWRQQWAGVWYQWNQIWPVNDVNLPSRIGSFENEAGVDCNAYVQAGWFHAVPSMANSPPGTTDWHVLVLRHSAEYVKQIAFDYYGDRIMQRVKGNPSGSFSAWSSVYPITADAGLPGRIMGTFQGPVSNDLNLQESGWTNSDASTANRPSDNYCIVMTVRHPAGGIAWQRATEVNGGRMGTVWQRVQWGGWQAWEKLWPLTSAVVPVDDANLPARLRTTGGAPADCNAMREDGFYYTTPGIANIPPGSTYCGVLVVNASYAGHARQIAYQYDDDRMWMRRSNSDSWTAWKLLASINAQKMAGGSTVVTLDGNAEAWIDTTTYYSGSPMTVVASNGDSNTNDRYTVSTKDLAANGFRVKFGFPGAAPPAGATVRVNWIVTYN